MGLIDFRLGRGEFCRLLFRGVFCFSSLYCFFREFLLFIRFTIFLVGLVLCGG